MLTALASAHGGAGIVDVQNEMWRVNNERSKTCQRHFLHNAKSFSGVHG